MTHSLYLVLLYVIINNTFLTLLNQNIENFKYFFAKLGSFLLINFMYLILILVYVNFKDNKVLKEKFNN